jgi:3-hydroxyacyl-CoA dehydrogenase
MPLVEVVRAPRTDKRTTLSTAMVTAAKLFKNAVITTDTPGFVVSPRSRERFSEAMHVDTGTPFEVVEESTKPFGLPMTPFRSYSSWLGCTVRLMCSTPPRCR